MHASRLLLLGVLASAACAHRAPEPPRPATRPAEVRALWVVRNTLNHPDSARAMVRRAAGNGYNTLIVQVRGRGDAYYDSRWEPRASRIAGDEDYDPLQLVIREAHARGLTVHAWLNTQYINSMDQLPSEPGHFLNQRPDLLAVPYPIARELYGMDPRDPRYVARVMEWSKTARDRVEGLYLTPAAAESKEHVASLWLDVLEKYDVDGMNFDYVRYPAPEYDYSRYSLDRFRRELLPHLSDSVRARYAALEAADPLVYADSFPTLYAQFRRDQITALVERIYYSVKKRKPHVIVSADVFGNAEDAYNKRFQDWRDWLRRGFLDVAALMAYSQNTDTFREQIRVAVEAGGPDRVWAGIGSWRIPVASTLEKVEAARSVGAKGIVLFSYDAAVRKGEFNPNGTALREVAEGAWGNEGSRAP